MIASMRFAWANYVTLFDRLQLMDEAMVANDWSKYNKVSQMYHAWIRFLGRDWRKLYE